MNSDRSISAWHVLLAVVFITAWATAPLFASRGVIDMLVFTALYSIAGLGVAFLLGQCGIVSLAQSVFFGIGAYASAYCTTHWGWVAPTGFVVGIAASGLIAMAVGWPILRLFGYFLALATLALAMIGQVLFLEWDWLTGGTLGIGGIPKLSLFGFELRTPQRFYYFVWPVAVLVLWLHANLLGTRNGFAMRAMRDAPAAAEVLGVDTHVLKVKMFVASAMLGSLGGSLFAHYVSFVSVDSFTVDRAIHFLLIAVLGGAKTIVGTVLGAAFVTVMPHWLTGFGDFHPLLFAACLIAAVMFLPDGFGGALQRAMRRRQEA